MTALAASGLLLLALPSAALADGGRWRRQKDPGGNTGNAVGNALGKPGDRSKGKPHSRRRPAAASPGVASPNAVRAQTADELVFGNSIRYHNLSIVPVGTKRQGPFQRYTLLEEGLRAQTLEVRELKGNSGNAQVSAVEVINRGRHPVYLLGGEMILGGKQDRIIQRDTVIENDGRWTRVSVFCVEQGRWRGQNMRFSSAGAVAHLSLRRAAMSGSQSRVWAEVAKKNLRHGTQNSTQTYRRTIQNANLRRKISPYRRKLVAMLPADIQLAGVVFAINGRIRVADLFGNPVLFGSLRNKLLSAYILEALGSQVRRNAPAITKGAAKGFIKRARATKRRRGKQSGRAVNYNIDNAEALGTETIDRKTGKKVRESYLAK